MFQAPFVHLVVCLSSKNCVPWKTQTTYRCFFWGQSSHLAWSWSVLCELLILSPRTLKRCVLKGQDLIKLIIFNVLSRTFLNKTSMSQLQVCGVRNTVGSEATALTCAKAPQFNSPCSCTISKNVNPVQTALRDHCCPKTVTVNCDNLLKYQLHSFSERQTSSRL